MKRKLKGSYTIEAVILMPIAIVLSFFFFYSMLFAYNKIIVAQNTYIAALRGSQSIVKQGKEHDIVLDSMEALITPYTLSVKNREYKKDISKKEVMAKCAVSMRIPLSESIKYILGISYEAWDMQAVRKTKVIRPVNTIRTYRKLENIGGK